MIAACIILIVLVFIALLRFGAEAQYGENGFRVLAQAGPFVFQVYPVLSKKRRFRKKRKKEEKPGSIKGFTDILPGIKKALGRLRRRLLIKKLTIHYTAAGGDAFKTALAYGASSAVFGMVVPLLENSFRIKKRDLSSSADFMADSPYIYINAAFSIAVWEAVYIALGALSIIFSKKETDGKEVKRYGKTSDR